MEVKGDTEQEETIDYLKQWFEDNDKLPKKIDRILLTRFYYCMYKDIEETKKLLEINYGMRQSSPDIFINRDPTDQDTENSAAYADMVNLPGLTAENYRISILRINNPDPKMMHHAQDIKAYIMVTDNRFSQPDVEIDGLQLLAEGEVKIVDMENFTLKHVPRLSIRVLRVCLKYLQLAYPVRIKAIHLINCPTYMDKILTVVKPFISREVFELIHFHSDGLETLYEHVPQKMLPDEYGGEAGRIGDFREPLVQSMLDKREYLMDPEYWKV